MKSFVTVAIVIVSLHGALAATGSSNLKHETNHHRHPHNTGSVAVTTENENGGDGANGGYISSSGAIIGEYMGANGENGGSVSVNQREEERTEFWRPHNPTSGYGNKGSWAYRTDDANEDINDNGNGANSGRRQY